jgi:cathepsin B
MCINTHGAIKIPLSAQDVCFCASNAGCNGGTVDAGWNHMMKTGVVTGGQFNHSEGFGDGWCADFSLPHCHHHGPVGRDPYPAEGTPGCPKVTTSPACPSTCTGHNSTRSFATDKYSFNGTVYFYGNVGQEVIQKAIMEQGPVEASFSVYADFENYAGGIYHHVAGGGMGGHAIRIVGWGVENGTDYWKVANSWNPYWGEDGFFRILRGTDECFIESNVVASGPTSSWGKMTWKSRAAQ